MLILDDLYRTLQNTDLKISDSSVFFCITMTLPGTFYLTDSFLKEPIRKLIQSCVEHGIWDALWTAEDHLGKIVKIDRQNKSYVKEEQSENATKYQFWILYGGLVISLIAFSGELVLGYFLK